MWFAIIMEYYNYDIGEKWELDFTTMLRKSWILRLLIKECENYWVGNFCIEKY